MRITKELLAEKHACREQRRLFDSLFPEGVEVTPELCERYADLFDWEWASFELLSDESRDRYVVAVERAYDKYDKKYAELVAQKYMTVDAAWRAYRDSCHVAEREFDNDTSAESGATYRRALIVAERTYDDTRDVAHDTYRQARHKAHAEYLKVCANTFGRLASSSTD